MAKTKEAKTSASLGAAIDAIGKMKLALLPLKAKVAAAEKKIAEAESKMLSRVTKSKLDGAAGKLARAYIDKDDIPKIDDYDKFTAYVRKKNAFDLMQRRISKEAWKLRVDDGVTIPGVGVFKKVELKVVLIRKKR